MGLAEENKARNKERMLKALTSSLGNVSAAAKASGVGQSTHYDWMKADPEYKQNVQNILDREFSDFLESHMIKRVKEGSDTMMIFMAKKKMKHRGYGDEEININPVIQMLQGIELEDDEDEDIE